ncbi:MAG: hypothetical protein NW215_12050 [Hyphomicrobiales bacterium]|nr:hypothetical protein [Hyphomicrobiales bacterium]
MTERAEPPKLPINIAWRSFGFVWRNLGAVIRVGFVPLLLAVSVYVLLFIYFPPTIAPFGDGAQPVPQIPAVIIEQLTMLLVSVMFVVGMHRLAILDERPNTLLHLRFQREEVKYLLTFIVFFLGFLLALVVLAGIGYALIVTVGGPEAIEFFSTPTGIVAAVFLYIVLFVLLMWPTFRLSLAFPHAAITGRMDFGLSWRSTRGNFLRYIGIAVLFVLILLVIYALFIAVFFGVMYTLAQIVAQTPQPGAIIDASPDAMFQGVEGWRSALAVGIAAALLVSFAGVVQAAGVTTVSLAYKALILRNYEAA